MEAIYYSTSRREKKEYEVKKFMALYLQGSATPTPPRRLAENVFEMREHFGPGWRMYFVQRG
jgi:putative component of toxin-antitoxin plasmid stabilization module